MVVISLEGNAINGDVGSCNTLLKVEGDSGLEDTHVHVDSLQGFLQLLDTTIRSQEMRFELLAWREEKLVSLILCNIFNQVGLVSIYQSLDGVLFLL